MASSPPSSHPHPSKKPRMSSSATASDADGDPSSAPSAAGEPRRRYKRRKVAIFLGYCGAGYQGMQKNPGARTIEGDLEEALFLADAVPAADRGIPRRYDWARSARTDKGVSAAAQVVSGRFYVDPPGFVDRLNAHLPEQIRVFGFKRATNSFNAKKFCDRRRYVYLLPVFALYPSAHPDREAVIASMGSDNELNRCLECSERGRKIPGLMGRFAGGSKDDERQTSDVTSFNLGKGVSEDAISELESDKVEEFGLGSGASDDRLGGAATVTNMDTIQEQTASDAEKFSKPSNETVTMEEKSMVESCVPLTEQTVESKVVNSTNGEKGVTEYGNSILEPEKLEVFDLGSGVSDDHHGASDMIPETKNSTNFAGNEVGGAVKLVSNEGAAGVTNLDAIQEPRSSNEEKCSTASNEDATMEEKSMVETGVSLMEQKMEAKVVDGTNREQVAAKNKFSYGDEQKEKFNRILNHYVGTHNFHNFTTRTKAEDPSARRYIISFDANYVVCIDGIEFVRCEVLGQSFMLHQIRKMIGLAVAVMRNCAPESLMDVALRKDISINVPTAPEVGLYLDECMFSSYNQKWKDSHEALTMDAYAEEAEEFRMKYIFPHIASMEHTEGAVALWLHSLNHRNYPDLRFVETNSERAAPAFIHQETTARRWPGLIGDGSAPSAALLRGHPAHPPPTSMPSRAAQRSTTP
ncbi:TRNA pseudouridine synthase [Canna indica]|uniref:tRNA pseudouridine synthase n=1 Tax=Canna indica TaxID=4628 RepID=A0AAQ3KMB5_9LILI|nr:TRNA pseudouridine synthase [Canna indica]